MYARIICLFGGFVFSTCAWAMDCSDFQLWGNRFKIGSKPRPNSQIIDVTLFSHNGKEFTSLLRNGTLIKDGYEYVKYKTESQGCEFSFALKTRNVTKHEKNSQAKKINEVMKSISVPVVEGMTITQGCLEDKVLREVEFEHVGDSCKVKKIVDSVAKRIIYDNKICSSLDELRAQFEANTSMGCKALSEKITGIMKGGTYATRFDYKNEFQKKDFPKSITSLCVPELEYSQREFLIMCAKFKTLESVVGAADAQPGKSTGQMPGQK